MNKQLYEYIMEVDFQKAEMLFMKVPDEKKRAILEELAYDTESMIIYSFVQYLIVQHEKKLYHEIEFDILTNALCHIEGAYQIALYHVKRLLELDKKSVQYREWMLSFYDVGVIDSKATQIVAKEIIMLDNDNLLARNFLKRLE